MGKPAQLADALRALVALVPRVDHIAATMTGELADCFSTKAEGVKFILNALAVAADGTHTRVYLTNGRLVSLQTAHASSRCWPLRANWHALANFAGRYATAGCRPADRRRLDHLDFIPLVDG